MRLKKGMQQLLVDILANTDRLDKISLEVEPVSHTILIRYEDLDEEWFTEMLSVMTNQSEES